MVGRSLVLELPGSSWLAILKRAPGGGCLGCFEVGCKGSIVGVLVEEVITDEFDMLAGR